MSDERDPQEIERKVEFVEAIIPLTDHERVILRKAFDVMEQQPGLVSKKSVAEIAAEARAGIRAIDRTKIRARRRDTRWSEHRRP